MRNVSAKVPKDPRTVVAVRDHTDTADATRPTTMTHLRMSGVDSARLPKK